MYIESVRSTIECDDMKGRGLALRELLADTSVSCSSAAMIYHQRAILVSDSSVDRAHWQSQYDTVHHIVYHIFAKL